MKALLFLALAAAPTPRFGQGPSADGGVAWPVDIGTASVSVGSGSVTVDGGSVAISNNPLVTVDGGSVAVTNFPATQYVVGVVTIDGGVLPVTIATLPASQSQGVDPLGAAHTMLTDTQGAQIISSSPRLPLQPCNPVRRTNCK